MIHNTPKTSSIEKALGILMAFTPHNHQMGTVELSQKLNLHPATVNRILKILSRKEFLRQDDRTRKFTLGTSVFNLARTIFHSLSGNLLNVAVPYLENLCEMVGETVVMEVMSNKSSIVAYVEQGRRGLSIGPNVGDIVPNHAAAGAKAMIAFHDPKDIDSFLGKQFRRFTEKTITDPQILRRELKQVRKHGVAFCREEMETGFNAIGAPVFNHDNKPVAAVVVAGLIGRVKCDTDSAMTRALKETTTKISNKIFYSEHNT
ncbi:MAG: IclR family transcriptional regulator [Deltaproteobacteria bacterium]|nr:IclR family transcriptional regulator [Deltaproteobacteria bacterium]MBW2009278.1 IclR family transcriptional regulator [Deltaproteobacteria bacterium]